MVTASGQLNPVTMVEVGSQISGIIQELLVSFNSTVKQGQLIARIDPRTYEANHIEAQGNLANARAALELAQLDEQRAKAFIRRCRLAKVSGVSLHRYRYAWAERARACGYAERFAQQALGHNSKAVHHAYSKRADVTVPSLNDWEKRHREDPQGLSQPKVVSVDFKTQMGAGGASTGGVMAGAAKNG